jgi:hypothetical protein
MNARQRSRSLQGLCVTIMKLGCFQAACLVKIGATHSKGGFRTRPRSNYRRMGRFETCPAAGKGFGGDVPHRTRDCPSCLIDRLEACPTTKKHPGELIPLALIAPFSVFLSQNTMEYLACSSTRHFVLFNEIHAFRYLVTSNFSFRESLDLLF